MKKLTTIFTAAVMFFTVSAFAAKSDEIPGSVKKAFEENFSTALNATWEKTENLYLVDFSWNASTVKAIFNADGELLRTFRNINIAQLPLIISLEVEKKYKGYKIQDNTVEIIADGQVTYHIVVSNEKETISLTGNASGDLTNESK